MRHELEEIEPGDDSHRPLRVHHHQRGCTGEQCAEGFVDVRPGSPTHGKWVAATLTAEAGEQLWVPRGFAHGYVTLTDDTELFYKVDGDYAPQLEGGLIWNDPDIGIAWPLDVEPVLSDKDKVLPRLKDMPKAEF